MLIGILSDSHGRQRAVREALRLFDSLGVEHVIHCGDVGGVQVFDELVGRACTFVWGNMDRPDQSVRAYLRGVGLRAPSEVPVLLKLQGRRMAVFHGHEPAFAHQVPTLDVDYVFHGHTHQRRDVRLGRKRIINPGALQRVRVKTVATLNILSDELKFHEIKVT